MSNFSAISGCYKLRENEHSFDFGGRMGSYSMNMKPASRVHKVLAV